MVQILINICIYNSVCKKQMTNSQVFLITYGHLKVYVFFTSFLCLSKSCTSLNPKSLLKSIILSIMDNI